MTIREACTLRWDTPLNGERPATVDEDMPVVARFLRGDSAAFDILFARYQEYVFHIVYGIVGNAEEARDITQDVFVQVYRSLPKFRYGSRFATWLYRIALNKAVDAARGSRKWRFLPIFETPGVNEQRSGPETDPEAVSFRDSERNAVQQALMQCPLNHRDVLVLRYYRDMSVEEIAETLDCSVTAAKVRLHRARKAFKDAYVAANGVQQELDNMDGGIQDAG